MAHQWFSRTWTSSLYEIEPATVRGNLIALLLHCKHYHCGRRAGRYCHCSLAFGDHCTTRERYRDDLCIGQPGNIPVHYLARGVRRGHYDCALPLTVNIN